MEENVSIGDQSDCDYYWPEEPLAASSEFVTSSPIVVKEQSDFTFDDLHSGLLIFEEIYGHLQVPLHYVVAADDNRFPPKLWGLDLGLCYEPFNRQSHGDYGVTLQPKKNAIDFESILVALARFKELFGHVNVRSDFTILESSICFPKSCCGMRLGHLIAVLSASDVLIIPEYQRRFEALGLVLLNCPPFETLYNAVKVFMETHNKVPASFVIPESTTVYDCSMIGCDLGKLMTAIVNEQLYNEHRDKWIQLKLPMKTRLIVNRQKRKIMYDPSEVEEKPKRKSTNSKGTIKHKSYPKTHKADNPWSDHGLFSASPYLKKQQQKRSKPMLQDSDGSDSDESLVSIGSDDGNIVSEIEAYTAAPLVTEKRKQKQKAPRKKAEGVRSDGEQSIKRPKAKPELNYEVCSAPIVKTIEDLTQQVAQLTNLRKIVIEQRNHPEIQTQTSESGANPIDIPTDANGVQLTVFGLERQIYEVNAKIKNAETRLLRVFNLYATEEMLIQRLDDCVCGRKSFPTFQVKQWRSRLAFLQRFKTPKDTPEIFEARIRDAVEAYKKGYGLHMPANYFVPPLPSFPAYTWDMNLSVLLNRRAPGDTEFRYVRLGISLNQEKYSEILLRKRKEALLDCIEGYYAKHKHLNIAWDYISSLNDGNSTSWVLMGHWLCDVLNAAAKANISENNDTRETSGTLEHVWFNCWVATSVMAVRASAAVVHDCCDSGSGTESKTLLALESLKFIREAMRTHCDVDPAAITADFVVPECDSYPSESWGLRLGIIMTTMIFNASPSMYENWKKKQKLAAFEIFKANCQRIQDHFASLDQHRSKTLSAFSSGSSLIDEDDSASEDDDELISSNDLLLLKQEIYRRRILNFIENPTQAFDLSRKANKLYKKLNRTSVVPIEYVVSEDDMHYPEAVRGFPLGLFKQWILNNGVVSWGTVPVSVSEAEVPVVPSAEI